MKRKIFAAVMAACALSGQVDSTNRSVAIVGFDDRYVKSEAGLPQAGGQLHDYLTSELSGYRGLSIVERQRLDAMLAEQKLRHSDLFDESKAVAIGKWVQADAIIVGRVNSVQMRTEWTGGEAVKGGVSHEKVYYDVSVSLRMISTERGTIVAAATSTQHEVAKGRWKVKTPFGTITRGQAVQTDQLANQALQKAAKELAQKVAERAHEIPRLGSEPRPEVTQKIDKPVMEKAPAPPVEVKVVPANTQVEPDAVLVADIRGSQVWLTGGKAVGLKVGDLLSVARPPVLHPTTGRPLGMRPAAIETVRVVSVDEQMAEARTVNGLPSKASKGDVVSAAPAVKPAVPAAPGRPASTTAAPVASRQAPATR